MKLKKLLILTALPLTAFGVYFALTQKEAAKIDASTGETPVAVTITPDAGTSGPSGPAIPTAQKIEAGFKQLRDYFPKTPQGEALAHVTALAQSIEDADEGVDPEFYRKKIELLESNPRATFATIKQALDAIPAEHSEARQELMQFAASLEVDRELKTELLTAEAKRPASKASAQDAAVALESLFTLSNYDVKALEPVFAEILKAHDGDKDTQRVLVAAFAAVDQGKSEEIKAKFGL